MGYVKVKTICDHSCESIVCLQSSWTFWYALRPLTAAAESGSLCDYTLRLLSLTCRFLSSVSARP